jgi:hypothetical protein
MDSSATTFFSSPLASSSASCPALTAPLHGRQRRSDLVSSTRDCWREISTRGRAGSCRRRRLEATSSTTRVRTSIRPLGTGRTRRVLRRRGSRRWDEAAERKSH